MPRWPDSPASREVGHPEVHGAALEGEHRVRAPLRPACSRALPQPELAAATLHDTASDLHAQVAAPVVPHPLDVPAEVPTAVSTALCRPLKGSSSRTTLSARPASMSAFTSAKRRSRSGPSGRIAFTASDAYSSAWNWSSTKVTFPPPRTSSQVFLIHSAPSEITMTSPASCSPRRRASRPRRMAKSEGSLLPWRRRRRAVDEAAEALAAPVLERRAGLGVAPLGGVMTASFASRVFALPSSCLPATPSVSSFRIGIPVPSIERYMPLPGACRPPPPRARTAAPPRRAPATSAAANSTRRPAPQGSRCARSPPRSSSSAPSRP